jgi:hypothetical protein
MDAKDHGENAANASHQNSICRLEWIAWAIEAARRHKESEHLHPPAAQPDDRFDSDDE